jgi:hypothetical protein
MYSRKDLFVGGSSSGEYSSEDYPDVGGLFRPAQRQFDDNFDAEVQAYKKRSQEIALAVSQAIRKYEAWLINRKDWSRTSNGWFTWARHGKNGGKTAHALRLSLDWKQSYDTNKRIIDGFLNNPKTCFHHHSLASFVLDELSELKDEPWVNAEALYPAYKSRGTLNFRF